MKGNCFEAYEKKLENTKLKLVSHEAHATYPHSIQKSPRLTALLLVFQRFPKSLNDLKWDLDDSKSLTKIGAAATLAGTVFFGGASVMGNRGIENLSPAEYVIYGGVLLTGGIVTTIGAVRTRIAKNKIKNY